jgi:murein DD-endopeptidase MepM/ murein hydrolase activator NlpD
MRLVPFTLLVVMSVLQASTRAASQANASGASLLPPPASQKLEGLPKEIILAPVYKQRHFCSEHTAVSWDLGDSLGTDCIVVSNWGDGYPKLYRTDGKRNDDWYGWHVDVLAPVSGKVVGTYVNNVENTPGVFGKGQASAIQIMTPDNEIVILVHVTNIKIARGDLVKMGQVIAQVGNSGIADAPHVHVGAYDVKSSLPLQIRWNLAEQARISGEH